MSQMRVGGSSRKDGMLLFGEHYIVSLDRVEATGQYRLGLHERPQKPLFHNGSLGLALAGAAVETLGEGLLKNSTHHPLRKLTGGLLVGACYGWSAYQAYRIFGNGRDVFKFHGAEHKVINAYLAKEDTITQEEAQTASRVSDRCGTNLLVYVTACGIPMEILPLGHGIFQSALTFGAAYRLFRMPEEKVPHLKSLLNEVGASFQKHLVTAEPEEEQLRAARKAMNLLIRAEKNELNETVKNHYLRLGQTRKWIVKYVL